MLTYHNLDIEIQTEGIISIASLHIVQRLNEHGRAMLRAVVSQETAMEIVEQADRVITIRISRKDGKKEAVFSGKAGEIRAEKEEGLFYLHMEFWGYTREFDLTDKSQSFCKGNDTYRQVLTKVLSEYERAQIRDEVTGGAKIPGMLMQYEETDWTFLKRLASHFSTFLVADSTADYGKVYFGIPHMDHNTVLAEEEYTLLKGKERYEKLPGTGELMPQEMMSWRLRSGKHMQLGEQVMLGYIETVVTAVDIMTRQGDLVCEYELSRRKGILTGRKTNPRIFGMSIPATVKERAGNQVRVQLDIDPSYEPSEDLKWFTYAIETSNFYCMPEKGSRVHIYFPGHEEQSAMAVHALRMGAGSSTGNRENDRGREYGSDTGKGTSGGHDSSGGDSSGGDFGGGGSVPAGAAAGAMAAAQAGAAEDTAEKEPEEKDPAYKVFSDPSGSYLELAPYGITFCPGSGSVAMTLQKSGMLSLTGRSMALITKGNILAGKGKKEPVQEICVEAEKTLQLSLKGGDSQITMKEETDILSTFVRKDAELKRNAMPLAFQVRAELMAGDAAERAAQNANSKESLTNIANEYKQTLLEEKKKEAEAKVRNGIFSVLTVVASVAVVVATGGAALPLAIAIGATATFKTVSAVSDIAEGMSDLKKVEAGDISQSYNFMRDKVFGGNEALYEGAKAVNDMVFGFVTGKAVTGNLAKVKDANKIVKTINSVKNATDKNKKLKVALNITGDVASGCIDDYVQNGSVNPMNVAVNLVSGSVKGFGMSNLRFNCGCDIFKSNFARKAANVTMQTTFATGVDYLGSRVTGQPFDLKSSLAQNLIVSGAGETFAEPVDAVTGAYMITTADLLLPDIGNSVRLERSYRSTGQEKGWLGKGWQFSYEGRLLRDGETFHVCLPGGYTAAFLRCGEKFTDATGNGRFTLKPDLMACRWHITDEHEHRDYCYNEKGLLEKVTDKNGQTLAFTYRGEYPEKLTTSLGYVVTFTFADGKLSGMTDDTGRSIGYCYQKDLLTEVVHMDGGVTRYAYSEEGYLTRPTDQTGLTYLVNAYDEKGRVVLQTLANGDIYRAAYHDREKAVSVEYSACPGQKKYFYDERMAVRKICYPDGTEECFDYDAGNNRTMKTDRLGRNTRWDYDDRGRLIREARPEGLVTEYHYDEAGDLSAVTDNGGREKLLAYDSCHNLVRRKIKTGEGQYTEQSYEYDSKGRLTKETNGEGHETAFRYEEDSAYPFLTSYSDGTELKCEYSRNGRKLSEDDGAVRREYAYNRGGWCTMERDGEGNETRYLYDGMGRKLAMYTPRQWKEQDGKRTDYKYDFLERLVDTTYPDGSHEKLFRDGEGNILKKVHQNAYDDRTKDGDGTCYDYDGENHVLRIRYPDGGVERFFYDAEGNRTRHVLPEQYGEAADDGPGWTYAYDEGNRLTSVTGPDGETEHTYAYDLWGNCVRETDGRGACTYRVYDLCGRLTRELVQTGEDTADQAYRMTTYEYDGNGNRVKETRHGGSYGAEGELLEKGEDLTLTFAYDARDRLVRVEDSLGARVSYRYDARGNRTYEEQVVRKGEDPASGRGQERTVLKKTRYRYDRAGRLIRKTELLDDGLSPAPVEAVTGYAYDANGNLTETTTPEGYRISREYDCRDRLIRERVEDPANSIEHTTEVSYDKAGNVISVRQTGGDGAARELSCRYDRKDRLVRAGETDGPVSLLSYDKNDRRTEQKQLLAMDGEAYGKTEFRYDIRGNLTAYSRNGTLLEQNSYDICGSLLHTVDGDGVEVSCRYGLQDEQREITTAGSRRQGRAAQTLAYDARGRITGMTDGCGNHTGYALDGWGRITAVETAEGGREEYAYDLAGNVTESRDAGGGMIHYAYNSMGKVCAITDQQGNTETFRYDKEGRQTQHTDRSGTVTETKYNVYDRPTMQTCTDRKGRRHVMGTWEYDGFGHLKKSVAGGFCYTYEYRPDGQLLRKCSGGKPVVSCTYYKNGTLRSLTDVSGKTLYYEYDGDDRLKTLKDEKGSPLTEYEYTAAGRLKGIRTADGNGVSYGYDSDGNLSHLRIGNGDTILYDAFMLYDLNGNRVRKSGERLGADGKRQGMDTAFRYDLMGRLTEERRKGSGERYSYDLNGNRTGKQSWRYVPDGTCVIDGEETYCYNERNELTQRRSLSAVTEYLYDRNGNLVSEKEGEKTYSCRYDLLNRQTHVRTPDGREQKNFYDGEGLRAGLTENGKSTTFLFHNGEILVECEGESVPVRRYVRGLGLSHVQTEDGAYHAYHQDEQGSTAYITGQGIENSYQYDAFGNLTEKKETFENRILYTGQQYDQETGQYYLRARYYNPVIGRFTQEDTYRGDGLNLYAYCGNNPVMYYDPNGHFGQCTMGDQAELEKQRVEKIGDGKKNVDVNGKNVIMDNSTFDPNFVDKQGRTNIQRMKQGLAPIGTDGKSVNIHHIDQTDNGAVMEIIATEHQHNYSNLHTNIGQSPSQINRTKFNNWRRNYWKWRSNNLD